MESTLCVRPALECLNEVYVRMHGEIQRGKTYVAVAKRRKNATSCAKRGKTQGVNKVANSFDYILIDLKTV